MLIHASEAATVAGLPSYNRGKSPEGNYRSQNREGFRQQRRSASAGGAAGQERAQPRSTALCIDSDGDRGGALATALAKLGYDVELASDGEEGAKKIGADRPDLIFYDASTLRSGIQRCLELLEQIVQHFPRRDALPLVLLTGAQDKERSPRHSARECVDAAQKGGSGRAEFGKGLTAREKDVLTWAARGKTSAEIGMILNLSERTINFHCDNAMRRLDVINRTQAVATAVAAGIIAP